MAPTVKDYLTVQWRSQNRAESGQVSRAMLPKGWRRSTLGEVAKFLSGNTPSKENAAYWGGDFPWVTARDMKTLRLQKATLGLTPAGHSAAAIAPSQSILVLTRGMTLLKDLPVCLIDREMAFNQDIKALVPNETVDATYLAYQLLANKHTILNLVDTAGHGTGRLDTDLLKYSELAVPPLPEQRRIARLLSTWDESIEITERMLANSRQQKHALTQSMLGSGVVPRHWKVVQIRDIADRVTRSTESNVGTYPILMISSSSGFRRQDEQYGRYMAGKSVESYILLHKGEFAYNKGHSKRYEFGCVFPLENYECGLVPHVYVCFALHKDCDPTFYKNLFQADYLHDQLGALVNTGVRNNGLLNIRPTDFMTVKVPLPPLKEQRHIAAILQAASDEASCFERDLEALRAQKNALMQQLLTGKRRVNAKNRAAVVPA